MTVTSLVAVVAPRTSKIVKNGFLKGENLLQNWYLKWINFRVD